MTFVTNGSERMRVSSSGHIFVGSSSYTGNTTGSGSGFYNAGDGMICFASGQSTPAIFNRTSADGKVIEIRKDGTTVGSIGANGSYPYIGSHGTSGKGLKITDALLPATNSGGFNDADVNLGASNVRWKDLYLSGSVKVPAASNGIEYSSTAFITPENNVSGAEVSTPGAFVVKTGSTPAERMRIDSSGNLLVGTTNSDPKASNVDGVQISGTTMQVSTTGTATFLNKRSGTGTLVSYRQANNVVGSVSVTASATAYNTSSDARLKDVTGEARGLEVINELNPVSYNWKADGKADEGLIAQEVLDIVPNAVSGSEEEMYQMDYSKLVVHLVKGMKEQQAQIEALQSEINELKNS